MIPYADLAAALENRAAPLENQDAAPLANVEDTTLSGAQLENQGEYELADDLAEEDNG
jgi:hypothetical protein